MNGKLLIGLAIVLLLGAQFLFGGKKAPAPAGTAAPAAGVSAGPQETAVAPRADEVDSIVMGTGGEAVALRRAGDGWHVASMNNAPADAAKVDRLVAGILDARAEAMPANRTDIVTGLENGAGLRVALGTKDGQVYDPVIGLRPEGRYDRTFARLPGGREVMLTGDIRGSLGLWKNHPGHHGADPAEWLDTNILRFDPEAVTVVAATYPDHVISFTRSGDGRWRPDGYVPGGGWNADGLEKWLDELAGFRVGGLADNEEPPQAGEGGMHSLRIVLGEGGRDGEKNLRIYPNHAGGEGMLVESDDFPGRVFHLPEWRFKKYFHVMRRLFPKAVPAFELADIRFIDVRRGGETVKIGRRDGQWRGVAVPYPIRPAAVDKVARLLAGLHPEDYANPESKKIRPGYGGPMVEVILADGEVHQYRLAGRHPLFPWRYVTLDGKTVFSITDAEAGVMFPEFAEIMDLGPVFPDLKLDEMAEVALTDAHGALLLTLRRTGDDEWAAEKDGRSMALDGVRAWRLVHELLKWRVAGFHDVERNAGGGSPAKFYGLRLANANGESRTMSFMTPEERNIPYLTEGGRGFMVDRADFFNWLGEARELMQTMEKEGKETKEAKEAKETPPATPIAVEAVANEKEQAEAEPGRETRDAAALSSETKAEPEAAREEVADPDVDREPPEAGMVLETPEGAVELEAETAADGVDDDVRIQDAVAGGLDVAPEANIRSDAAAVETPLEAAANAPEDDEEVPQRPTPANYVGRVGGLRAGE